MDTRGNPYLRIFKLRLSILAVRDSNDEGAAASWRETILRPSRRHLKPSQKCARVIAASRLSTGPSLTDTAHFELVGSQQCDSCFAHTCSVHHFSVVAGRGMLSSYFSSRAILHVMIAVSSIRDLEQQCGVDL